MDPIEEIKSKIDIVDFISQYISLKKSGSNFKALCPFHSEKTPSFFVSPEKQIWHCFGCSAGGDIFGFLIRIEHLEFPEALQILAQKAGVSLKKYDSSLRDKKTTLYKINNLTTQVYHKILLEHPKGGKALNYLLKERKIPLDIIKKFQIGFAPSGYENLLKFLKNKGYSKEELIESGVARRTEGGRVVDLFKERIIFPLKDHLGRIVGFSARALNPKDEPKYLNTPQTLIFDKSNILYGLFEGKEKIREEKSVIVCEGQMDVLACHKVRIENVVCSSGTAFTEKQISLLKKYTNKIFFAFDKDLAGEEALLRSLGLALDSEFTVKVVLLKGGKDPDEIIKKNPELFKKAAKTPLDFLDFYFSSISDKIDTVTVEGKREVLEKIFPLFKKIKNKIEQSKWLSSLASFLKVEDKVIFDAFSSFKNEKERGEELEFYFSSKNLLVEEQFLGMLLAFPSNLAHFIVKIVPEDFSQENLFYAYQKLQKYYTEKNQFLTNNFLKSLDSKLKEKLECLYFGAKEFYKDFDDKKIFEEMTNYASRLKKIKFEKKKKELLDKIKEAENEGDQEEIKKLLLKLQKILLEEKTELK